MNNLNEYKFSKIGTNPMKYFENYVLYINSLPIGEELKISEHKIFHRGVEIFNCNSEATFRQNIDSWIWMGFVIKNGKNSLIKVIKEDRNKEELLQYSKFSLLLDSGNNLTNKHRKTIIIKILSMKYKKSVHVNYSYEEIIKECGKFEEKILSDETYVNVLSLIWERNL